jgi:hypothetical protein
MHGWMKLSGGVVFAVAFSTVLAAQAPQQPQGGQPVAGAAGAGAPGAGGQGGRGGAGGRGGGRGAAAPAPVIPVDPKELGGFWQLPPYVGEGRNVPAAVLVAGVTRARLAAIEARDREAIRYCDQMGMPAMMGLGTVYEIRVSPKFAVIMTEYGAAPNRWIYLNRSTHIPADTYEPALNGDSIGRWERNTLVVETTMFTDRGILAVPGGGFRTPESKLVERFTMLKNGQHLQVTSTWTDPKVFRTPHTYEYRYNRVPHTYEPHPSAPCDQYDDQRVAFLAATAAKKVTP